MSTVEVGNHLGSLRERAGIKQSELAKRVSWSQAVLSRMESGDREISEEELNTVLAAIGTEDALLLAERLQRKWTVLQRPPLDHPDQELLWEAEEAGKQLQALSDQDNVTASFKRRLDEYLIELKQLGNIVLRRDHTIAFIGSIGIGKSTAICRLTGLEVIQGGTSAQPVLEAGAGGITVCEVHVYKGPEYGLTVEPCTDDEVRQHVFDFVEHIRRNSGPQKEGSSDGLEVESQGISKEIDRVIRNMAGIRVRKEKVGAKIVRKDEARELAAGASSNRELVVDILSRMQMHRRDSRHAWYDASTGKAPLEWIRELFEAINNGRHPDFSLPRRIEIIVPDPIVSSANLPIRIVDTKGVDRTAARADLEGHLNEPHTVAVLCSGFNNAPSAEARLLVERAKEAGIQDLELRVVLAVFPRPDEALAVKDDSGERVESSEEGYDLKGEQVRAALEPIGLADIPITFFNAREDAPSVLRDFLVDHLSIVRAKLCERLRSAATSATTVIENQAQEQTQAVIRDAADQLRHWINQNGKCPSPKQQVQTSLIKEIRAAHASTIHAAIRRGGDWPNLDFAHQLGHGARVLASLTLRRKVQDFQAIAQNLRTNDDFSAAANLVVQCEKVLISAFDDLLRKMQIFGEALFEDYLKKDLDYWAQCERVWGQGPGYRDTIASQSHNWFDDNARENVHEDLTELLSHQWEDALQRVAQLLDVE